MAQTDVENETGALLLDLATMPPNETVTRPGGQNVTYNGILIVNAIPRFVYGVVVDKKDVGIAPLPAVGGGATPPPGTTDEGISCDAAIARLLERLDAVEAEKDVPDIGAEEKVAAPSGCKDAVWTKFTSLTRFTSGKPIDVKSYQTLTVTASRPGATFVLELPGTARGEWRTSYGFFFVPDRDERYFVKETAAATTTAPAKFMILKQQDREEFDFVPTVVFTFFPNGAGEMDGVRGWTAGLGYDLEKPFVFGGYSYAYNENVIFTGGVAFHRQSRLLGKYEGGKDGEVTQPLEPGQLIEDTYGPNVYVGISFRFGEDIHARRKALEDAKATAAKAEQDAAATIAKAKAAEALAACQKTAKTAHDATVAKCTTDDTVCKTAAAATLAAAEEECLKKNQ